MIEKLGDFGHTFQLKLVAALISDRLFLQQIIDILHVDYFQSDANRNLVKIIQKYFIKYKTTPTLEVLSTEIKKIDDDVLYSSIVKNLKEIWVYTNSPDISYVKQESLNFCKNQHLRAAILESVDLLELGRYDDIKVKIDNALKAGIERNLGHNLKADVKQRYQDNVRHTIPTPWPIMNDLLDGGLGAGELGIIVGGPGSGKSWALQAIGANALLQGKTVIYYTLELVEEYSGKRFDAILTGIPVRNLKFHEDDVSERLQKIKSELWIKYYPEKTISLQGMHAHMEKFKNEGHHPDLVIIDYIDCVRLPAGSSDRYDQQLTDLYSELRGVAGEMQLPIWSASQAGRSSEDTDIVQGKQISDSYGKVMKGDFVVSLSRKVTDKISGTARWFIIKNRFGPDGITLPSKINMENGNIQIFQAESIEGRQAKSMMDEEHTVRKYLGERFNKFKEGD